MWDEVAEWLRRWTANPMCIVRVGSNPILVEKGIYFLTAAVTSPRGDVFINSFVARAARQTLKPNPFATMLLKSKPFRPPW